MAQQTKSASRGSSANSSTKRAAANGRSTTPSRPKSSERTQANTLAQKLKTPALAAGAAAPPIEVVLQGLTSRRS